MKSNRQFVLFFVVDSRQEKASTVISSEAATINITHLPSALSILKGNADDYENDRHDKFVDDIVNMINTIGSDPKRESNGIRLLNAMDLSIQGITSQYPGMS